jgi:hypothetical protein
MSGRHVIAEGTHTGGLSWTLWVVRDKPSAGDLLNMIRVTHKGGHILHGSGFGGSPLDPDRLLKVKSDGSGEGPRVLLARAHPDVRKVVVTTENGDSLSVPMYDIEEIPEIRFGCLLLPRDLPLRSITALGADDQQLERLSLSFQQGQWEARGNHRRRAQTGDGQAADAAAAADAAGAAAAVSVPAQQDGRGGQWQGRHLRGAATARR